MCVQYLIWGSHILWTWAYATPHAFKAQTHIFELDKRKKTYKKMCCYSQVTDTYIRTWKFFQCWMNMGEMICPKLHNSVVELKWYSSLWAPGSLNLRVPFTALAREPSQVGKGLKETWSCHLPFLAHPLSGVLGLQGQEVIRFDLRRYLDSPNYLIRETHKRFVFARGWCWSL